MKHSVQVVCVDIEMLTEPYMRTCSGQTCRTPARHRGSSVEDEEVNGV